jgi:glycosyltransferase involved in cell wall biosynthesis
MSEASMPTVSAVIPTYNRARHVVEAIDSVLAQSRPPDEIIVIDDGSTDDTAERLKKYGLGIRYVRQENRGPSAARNRGMKEAQGDFVAFLDSDDLWVSGKTEMQLNFFASNPHIDFVFGNMVSFSEEIDGESLEIKDPAIEDYLVAHQLNLERFFELLIVQNVVATGTVMARRVSLSRVGDFDESRAISEDFDYWLRAAVSCRWGFVNSILMKRRRHSGNLIASWTRWNIAMVRVLEGTARRLATGRPGADNLISRKLRATYYDLGSAFLKQRDFKSAFTYLDAGRPLRRAEYKWRLKLFAASALRHWPSKSR